MATKIIKYQCPHCKKSYNEESAADVCEVSCAKQKAKEDLNNASHEAFKDKLTAVRTSSENFSQLFQEYTEVLKEYYGNDFDVFFHKPECSSISVHLNIRMQHKMPKSCKGKAFMGYFTDTELDVSRLIEFMGFDSGGGNGYKDYWVNQCKAFMENFPSIEQRVLDDKVRVSEINDTHRAMSKTFKTHVDTNSMIGYLKARIEEDQESIRQLQCVISEKEHFIVQAAEKFGNDLAMKYNSRIENSGIDKELAKLFGYESDILFLDTNPLRYIK